VTLKQFVIHQTVRLVRWRGYQLAPLWRLASQPLAHHLRAIFDRYRVDCVLDVGGNMGQYHDLLRDEVGFDGCIVSFEPVSKYSNMLMSKSATEANWHVFDHALGSSESTGEIRVTHSPGLNSFLAPRTDAVKDFWRNDSVESTETVRIRRLDDVFPELQRKYGIRSPYLKLDTQGFDLEVLKGAPRTLDAVCALQTEASIKPIYEGMPSYQEMINYLTQAGFELSGMFPIVHDEALRLIEFDCLMVNSARKPA
jgi:FkbM family methyltransferase